MSDSGSITAALDDELQCQLRDRGIVVWLNRDGHYTPYVDALAERHGDGDFFAPVVPFRGAISLRSRQAAAEHRARNIPQTGDNGREVGRRDKVYASSERVHGEVLCRGATPMNDELPSFCEAELRFRDFVRWNNLSGGVIWVFRDDIAVKRHGIPWIRLPVPEQNRALVEAMYEEARPRVAKTGICLDVFCPLPGNRACAYVFIPPDPRTAELHMIRGLKLSILDVGRTGQPWGRTISSRLRFLLAGWARSDPWLEKVPTRAETLKKLEL